MFYFSCVCILGHSSHVRLFATLWDVAWLAPLSMEFPRQEYWNGLPCPPPGDLPDSGIKPMSLTSPALAGEFFTTSCTWATLWPNNEGGLSDWTIYWATYSCKTSWSQETQKSIFFFQSWVPILPLLMCFFSGNAFAEWLRAHTLKSALQLCHL